MKTSSAIILQKIYLATLFSNKRPVGPFIKTSGTDDITILLVELKTKKLQYLVVILLLYFVRNHF